MTVGGGADLDVERDPVSGATPVREGGEHQASLERFAHGEPVRADELHAALSQVFDKFGWTRDQEDGPFDVAGRLATYIDNQDG